MNSYIKSPLQNFARYPWGPIFGCALMVFQLALLPSPLYPAQAVQEEGKPLLEAASTEGRILIVDKTNLHFFVEGDYQIVLLHGNVHITYDHSHIYADNIVLWYDYTESRKRANLLRDKDFRYDYQTISQRGTGLSLPPFPRRPVVPEDTSSAENSLPWAGDPLELYAEGNVKVLKENHCFFCDQLYTNLAEKRGVILSGEFFSRGDIKEKEHPIHFKAAALKQVCENLYTLEEASFSTCVFGHPHYEVKVGKAVLRGDTQDGLLSFTDSSIATGGLSLLPLPDTSFQIGRHWHLPIKRIKAGRSSRFGWQLLVTLEEDIDRIGNALNSALGTDKAFRGDASLDIDLYEKRGLGLGPEIEYKTEDLYEGYLKGYYINDGSDTDRGDHPIEENKRGRIRTQNRIKIDDETLLDLELSYITDSRFLDEYFEDEFKTDKEQETYLYLHRTEGSQAFSLLSRFRLNDFDTQNEYLPQGIWDVSSIPVFSPPSRSDSHGFFQPLGLFYSHKTELSHVRNRPGDDSLANSERLFRADYLGTYEAPIRIDALKVAPFYENRLSFFERRQDESDPTNRISQAYGVKAGILFHSRSDFESDFLNIHGLRNLVEPAVEYKNTFAINRETDELIEFDSVERGARGDQLNLILQQRIQTRKWADVNTPHTLYNALFKLPLYPDRRLSERGDHRTGNLSFDIWLNPLFQSPWLKNIRINEEGEYDPYEKRTQTLNSTLLLIPSKDHALSVKHRWIRHRYSYLNSGFRVLMTHKWEAEFELQYNLRLKEWAEKSFILRRRAHQWIFEIKVSVDEGDNDSSVTLSISPLALFSGKTKGSIYDPMFGE